MKTKTLPLVLVVAALAALGGWIAARQWPAFSGRTEPADAGRKILYYQSAMHPWIKSDKPGKCTICGMDLVPVSEGDKGFDATTGLVTLGSNTVNVLNVQTEEVRRRPLRHTLKVAGIIEEDDTRHRIISAYVDGRIDRLFVNHVGAEVTQSQPMAAIYSPALLTAEREYVSLLTGKPGVGGLRADQARLAEAAMQRLRRLGLTEGQIVALPQKPESDLDTDIVAPMSGTVVARSIYEGQYVKEGDRLFEIADFSTMWFRFDAYERDVPWLKAGQQVEVSLPAIPGRVYRAVITFIDPNLNDPTRSAKVRVEMSNPIVEQDGKTRRELYHRLYAEGSVQVDLPEALAVRRGAVLSPSGRPLVYVARSDGAYEPRSVTLGRRGDDFWEVLDGLSPGEVIVTAGNLLIDAQAQLSQTAQRSESPAVDQARTNVVELNVPQQAAASRLVGLVDEAGSALAADNVGEFNRAAAALHGALPEFLNAFERAEFWHPLLQKIAESGHLEKAPDLATARRQFLTLSLAVADFARELRKQPAFVSLKIFQCPMVNSAIPGAPKTGLWIQRTEALRNPFFGSRMIDCGTEVK